MPARQQKIYHDKFISLSGHAVEVGDRGAAQATQHLSPVEIFPPLHLSPPTLAETVWVILFSDIETE